MAASSALTLPITGFLSALTKLNDSICAGEARKCRFAISKSVMVALFLIALSGHLGAQKLQETIDNGPTKRIANTQVGYAWKQVAIGAGGFITGYDSDKSGETRVVRTDVYGAYRWDQATERWVQLVDANSMPKDMAVQNGGNEGVYEIKVAPSDPKRIYMAFKGAIYRSFDAGKSFARTSLISGKFLSFDPNSVFRNYGPFISIDPSDPNVVLFGSPEDGLWRSTDAGGKWSKVTSVPPALDKLPYPRIQTPGIITWFTNKREKYREVWAMSPGNGLFKSIDGGANFERLSPVEQKQPKTLKQGEFSVNGTFYGVDPDDQALWRYTGEKWENLVEMNRLPPRRYASVSTEPRDSSILVADEGAQTYFSRDGGITWAAMSHASRVGPHDPPYLRVSNVSYFPISRIERDPISPEKLWVGAGTGVYFAVPDVSTRRITWTSQTAGIEELVANDIAAVPGMPPAFAGWDFGIHVKPDLDAFSETYGPMERVVISAQQLASSPSNPQFLATNASDARLNCCSGDGNAVLAGYSMDGGKSWKKFASLPTPPGTTASDPWRMSFGSIAVAADNVRNIIWVPTFDRSPFFTKDLGQTWSRVVLQGEITPFTGSHSALHLHRKTIVADSVLPGVFYWVHSGTSSNAALKGLWKTIDGGSSWSKVFQGEVAPLSQYSAKLRAVPHNAGHLFFTSGIHVPNSDTRLRRSKDGGTSWQTLENLTQIDDIAFGKTDREGGYPAIYVSGQKNAQYGIWRSLNDGESWSRIAAFPLNTLDQVTVMQADPEIFGRLYIGYKGSGWIYGEPKNCVESYANARPLGRCTAID